MKTLNLDNNAEFTSKLGFSVVAPIFNEIGNLPELYRYYVPLDATFYLTIYDDWGRRKLERFHSLGLTTEVLWMRSFEEKGIRGSDVRKRMATGDRWEHLVPPRTARIMRELSIPERLRQPLAAPPQPA